MNPEFCAYASGYLSALDGGKDASWLADHLAQIRSVSMGLGSADPTVRDQAIGIKLVARRERRYQGEFDF